MSLYQVCGTRAYRGFQPNMKFEATLNTAAEHRAIERGAIRLLERTTPSIQPGSYRLPEGWLQHQEGNDV